MGVQTVYGEGLHLLSWNRIQPAGDNLYNSLKFLQLFFYNYTCCTLLETNDIQWACATCSLTHTCSPRCSVTLPEETFERKKSNSFSPSLAKLRYSAKAILKIMSSHLKRHTLHLLSSSFSPPSTPPPPPPSSSSSSSCSSSSGTELPLMFESYAFSTTSFHFPQSWTQVNQFLTIIWQISCLALSSHRYLGLPCDLF